MRIDEPMGFSGTEFPSVQAAAGLERIRVSSYLQWLLQRPLDNTQRFNAILLRLDGIFFAIVPLADVRLSPRAVSLRAQPIALREVIEKKVRARGVPSSTNRKVAAAWDEVERKAASAAVSA